MNSRPDNKQPSVFKSPAARRLAIAGSVVGCGVGVFAGVCGSMGQPSNFVRNTLIGSATGAFTFGMFGFFAGAGMSAAARTRIVKSAASATTDAVKKMMK